jgi:hypothetical protein
MLNTSTAALAATSKALRETPEPDWKTTAKTVQRLLTADRRDAIHLWGNDFRGLLPLLFEGCVTPLTDSVVLITDATGRVTGFAVDGVAIDYADPATAPPAAWQPASLAIARRAGSTPMAEEVLVRSLADEPFPSGLRAALADIGLGHVGKLGLAAANRLERAIVAEALTNGVPAARQGNLVVARSFGTVVRQPVLKRVMPIHRAADLSRDLVMAAPIVALSPPTLDRFMGESQKAALRHLGLPVEARRVKPKALSPLRRWLLEDDRHLSGGDLPWLTGALCAALPDNSLLQYRIMELAASLLLAHAGDERVAAISTWAARHAAELFEKGTADVRDWLAASDGFAERYAIRAWNPEIGVVAAIEAAGAVSDLHRILRDPVTSASFPLPGWAVESQLPHSKWTLHPVRNEADLIAASRVMANCSAAYGDTCRTGQTLIALAVRPVTEKGRKLPRIDGLEIGAMAEISHWRNRWRVVQLKGYANGEPVQSAAAAIARLVDQVNGGAQ